MVNKALEARKEAFATDLCRRFALACTQHIKADFDKNGYVYVAFCSLLSDMREAVFNSTLADFNWQCQKGMYQHYNLQVPLRVFYFDTTTGDIGFYIDNKQQTTLDFADLVSKYFTWQEELVLFR